MKLSDKEQLSTWFDKIFQRTYWVEQKIYQKKGFLFFKIHAHSPEELFELKDYKAIYSATETIHYNLRQWEERKRLDKDTREFYSKKREEVSSRMNRINQMIAERQPTFWEEFKGSFKEVTKWILNNLPTLIELSDEAKKRGWFRKLKLPEVTPELRRLLPGKKPVKQ